jgi:hypothetical protein
MNSARKIAVLLVLSGIAGCKHNVQSAAPPPAPARVYFPDQVAKSAPLPQLPPPQQLNVTLSAPEKKEPPTPPKKNNGRHKSKATEAAPVQTTKDATPPAAAPAQEASAGQPPAASPIGQLSSSSDSSSALNPVRIHQEIEATENGLKGIKRELSSDEKQTAAQIQTFLEKAKKALDENDLDGANTLLTKAKVLLQELAKG